VPDKCITNNKDRKEPDKSSYDKGLLIVHIASQEYNEQVLENSKNKFALVSTRTEVNYKGSSERRGWKAKSVLPLGPTCKLSTTKRENETVAVYGIK
jgi:hypothetical protein